MQKNGAKFLSMDLKDMFLHTPMEQPEHMKVPIKYFPMDIQRKYNILAMLIHYVSLQLKTKNGDNRSSKKIMTIL